MSFYSVARLSGILPRTDAEQSDAFQSLLSELKNDRRRLVVNSTTTPEGCTAAGLAVRSFCGRWCVQKTLPTRTAVPQHWPNMRAYSTI